MASVTSAIFMLCLCLGALSLEPVYELSNVLSVDTEGHGYLAWMAQDPRDPYRLLLSDGVSRIWEISNYTAHQPPRLYAGNGTAAHQDGERTAAEFNSPHGLCVDPHGSVFVADTNSATVRRIDEITGQVTTVAGQPNMKGDHEGGPDQSLLSTPTSLTCLTTGGVLVGDPGARRLSLLNCVANCSADAIRSGGLPVYELTHIVSAESTAHGYFSHMTQDPRQPNRLLFSDGVSRIWELKDYTSGTQPTPYAGTGDAAHGDGARAAAGFNSPHGLCVDPHGSVFVADTNSATVRRIDEMTGQVTTVAGRPNNKGAHEGGPDQSLLSTPTSLICLPTGGVLVGDPGARRLSQLSCVRNCDGQGGGGDSAWKRVVGWLLLAATGAAAAYGLVVLGTSHYVRSRIEAFRLRHSAGRPHGSEARVGGGDEEQAVPLLVPEEDEEEEEEEEEGGEPGGGEADLLQLEAREQPSALSLI